MFRVHVPAEQQAIHLDVSGEADIVYTVTNTSSKSLPGRAEIQPELGAETAWFRVAEPRHRPFRGEEAQQFKIEVNIPADTPAGTYGFRLVAVNEDNPDEDFAEGESITLHWDPGLVKRIDRTVIALLTLVGIVGLLAISGVIYLVANREIRPPETLRAANRAAEAGQWEDYWDCWTEEGQDELLVRTAGMMQTAKTNAEQKGEQNQDLDAWIRTYGVPPEDLAETARLLKQRFQAVGRTEKDFFVGAAQWLEDATEADPSEFRREFQYELNQAEPIDDDLAQHVAIWDGKRTSPAATGDEERAEQEAVTIYFHKTGRRWLLHDVDQQGVVTPPAREG